MVIIILLLLCAPSLSEPYNIYSDRFSTTFSKLDNKLINYFKTYSQQRRFKRDTSESVEDFSDDFDIPSRPNYKNVGQWAKGKTPVKEVDLDWVPLQIYSQVRRTNSVEHLPREAAVQQAKTSEEIINAPRLKEVHSHKKIQQVYEEEGFEDSSYDHGGYNHQGAKYADISKQEAAERKHTEEAEPEADSSKDSINKELAMKANHHEEPSRGHTSLKDSYPANEDKVNIFEDTPFHLRTKYISKHYGDNSGINLNPTLEKLEGRESDISQHGQNGGKNFRIIDNRETEINASREYPGESSRRSYVYFKVVPPAQARHDHPHYHQLPPLRLHIHATAPPKHGSPSAKIYSANHFLPVLVNVTPRTTPIKIMKNSQSSGTDALAAYATLARENITTVPTVPFKIIISDLIFPDMKTGENFWQESGQNDKSKNNTQYSGSVNLGEPSSKWIPLRSVLNTRHPSVPRDGREIYDYKLISISDAPKNNSSDVEGNQFKSFNNPKDSMEVVKYIENLTIQHFAPPQKMANKRTQVPKTLNTSSRNYDRKIFRSKRETTPMSYNRTEYPFYEGVHSISQDSAVKYATNPALRPDKTKGGMAFYEQRDRSLNCEDPGPADEVTPTKDKDEDFSKTSYEENMPRLGRLGDKILCFKKRYFGENPLNNPFFQEEIIDNPTFELDDTVKDYIAKASFLSSPNNSSKARIMVIPESEETESEKVESVSNNFKTRIPYKNHKSESEDAETPIDDYQHEPNQQQSTYEKPEQILSAKPDVPKKKRKPPYAYFFYKRKYPSIRKHYTSQILPVPVYSVVNRPYHHTQSKPIMIAHSMKHYRVVPLQSDDSTEDHYQTTTGRYYIIRPGEYTHNKELLNQNKGSDSFWNYINPLRWWFPSLFDNRRKEPKYRNKRDMPQEDLRGDAKEQSIPANHKTETTTGKPISLEEFKARFNITSKPSKVVQLDMISGGFLNISAATRSNDVDNESRTSELPSDSQITPSPSLQTTTRSTIGTSAKPKLQFIKTNIPKRKVYSRKPTTFKRGAQKFTTTTPSTTTLPSSTTRRTFFSRKMKKTLKRTYKKPSVNNLTSTSEMNTKRTFENPQKFQNFEPSKVTKNFVEHIVPSDKPPEDKSLKTNGTLTYVIDSATGNGSWQLTRKSRVKSKRRGNKKKKNSKSQKWLPELDEEKVVKDGAEADDPRSTAQSNEAYIIGLLSKVPPISSVRKPSKRRQRLPKLEVTTAVAQTKNDYIPTENTRIPLKFILQPNKRKYYYVINQ